VTEGRSSTTATAEPQAKADAGVEALRSAATKVVDAVIGRPDAVSSRPTSSASVAGITSETGGLVAAAKIVHATAAPIVDATIAAPPVARAVAAPTGPRLINVIGSFVWHLFDDFTNAIVGPPVVPAGLSVNARRSKLAINCGPGITVNADWYYPTDGQPDKFIYFQHGFLGNASVYNETLADLADRNNAIVVAPSITSNKFDCYACFLDTDSMNAAVANLFVGDRAALAASAAAAGYQGALPEKFVFVGQSEGTQLVSGAAGFYYQLAPADERSDLVGVLLYDGSAAEGTLPGALAKLPDSVPVLQISAQQPNALDLYGSGNQALTDARPGQFNGVELVGGAHSDGFRSTKFGGLIQLFVGLVFGFSKPQNVEAVQDLSQGWITDMYAGTVNNEAERTGIYGAPGQLIDIPTDTRTDAQAWVLPGPAFHLTVFDQLIANALDRFGSISFPNCVSQPATAASEQSAGPVHGCAARHEMTSL
jgi:hypothetical protein